jgi:hypothetical protein
MKSNKSKSRRRSKLSKNELLRRLRLGDLRRLLLDRCGSILPDDDAGREYLRELLLPISLGPNEAVKRARVELWGPTDRMRREIELRAPWMNEDEARDLRLEINAISKQGSAAAIRCGVETCQRVIPNHVEFGDVRPVTDGKYALTVG